MVMISLKVYGGYTCKEDRKIICELVEYREETNTVTVKKIKRWNKKNMLYWTKERGKSVYTNSITSPVEAWNSVYNNDYNVWKCLLS